MCIICLCDIVLRARLGGLLVALVSSVLSKSEYCSVKQFCELGKSKLEFFLKEKKAR